MLYLNLFEFWHHVSLDMVWTMVSN